MTLSANPSVGLLAVRAIATALGSLDVPVALTDTTEYTPELLPAYNVFRKKDSFEYEGDRAVATAKFEIVVRAMVKATSQAEEAIDPLVVSAWQGIAEDPTLGGIVADMLITGVEYQYIGKGEYDMLAGDVLIEVEVDVSRSDPTVNKTYLS